MRTLCGTILGAMVVASAQAKMEAAFGIGNSRYDGIVRNEGAGGCQGYLPPLLMNGELAMTVDRTFAVLPHRDGHYSRGIFLEGRRVGNPKRELLPQGGWRKILLVDGREPAELRRWEQELNVTTMWGQAPGVGSEMMTFSTLLARYGVGGGTTRRTGT